MPGELTRFETEGPSWGERAHLGELNAVLSPGGSETRNYFLHQINMVGAKLAASMKPDAEVLIDFGCGTGRFLRYFSKKGFLVIGTEITKEMLTAAKKFGVLPRSALVMTDGLSLPFQTACADIIWCCGVLRYSLLVPNPVYRDLAQEMYRVLKPGGLVINVEMYVDQPPATFTKDFEEVGFKTEKERILQRYGEWPEKIILRLGRHLGKRFIATGAALCARARYRLDNPNRPVSGLRDYFFVWSKPLNIDRDMT
jgi:ubiquinone/menaquinone biosynthesis C-methylase UbiE